jgi:lysozyme
MSVESTAQSWVADLQTALNQRAAPRGYPQLSVDGVLGPLTQQAVQDLGHALGIEPELLAAEQLAPEVVKLFADPKRRSSSQLATAGANAAALAGRQIELDGVELAWGLVKPLVRARGAGWTGTLNRVARGADVLEGLFEGRDAWWHRVLEVSQEGQLSTILGQMGYACELVAHSKGLVGPSGVRFLEQPGEVEPGAVAPTADASPPEVADPTQATEPTEMAGPTQPTEPPPAPESPPITGPDVSADQGPIDWDQVASAGHGFAFIRATAGVDTIDQQFAANWQNAGAAGIRRGAYHLAEPAQDRDPGDQAVNMVVALHEVGGAAVADLPPSVVIDDLADTIGGEQLIGWVRAFSSVFARITHSLPVIRLSVQSLSRALGSDASALDGPVWISDDSQGSASPQVATPPTEPASFEPLPDDEQCPGISGPCQLSRFRGSQQQFDELGSGAQMNN